MNKLDQRLKRLEVKQDTCNHRPPHELPVILNNPTDEEIQQKEKELAECANCRRNGKPESTREPRAGRALDGGQNNQ
jgi:hypothetical protein